MIGKIVLLFSAVLIYGQTAVAQNNIDKDTTKTAEPAPKVPFDGYDLSWVNGQNRQTDFPLVLKDKDGVDVATISGFADCYYNYDFSKPVDNTFNASASMGRCNEFTFNLGGLGIDVNYHNAIGRLWLQYGQMESIVQATDSSVNHGRNTSLGNVQYIREAAAGYHFDVLYGVNAEMGIFTSFIGLESYVLNENWCYQRSLLADFTPFYLTGARTEANLSKKLLTELWLINGWQTYDEWNTQAAIGSATIYRPNTNVQLIANFYLAGHDVRDAPGVLRFHHDHSAVVRYYHNREKKVISQAAFSVNDHYGFQTGDGILPKNEYMLGTSIANRIWFHHDKLAITLRGDYLTNPGEYLVIPPSPVTNNAYTEAVSAGRVLTLFQGTVTLDIMPTQFTTFRIEYGYRSSNIPYFAGAGGTTSPDGYTTTPVPPGWMPDLTKSDSRVTMAVTLRI